MTELMGLTDEKFMTGIVKMLELGARSDSWGMGYPDELPEGVTVDDLEAELRSRLTEREHLEQQRDHYKDEFDTLDHQCAMLEATRDKALSERERLREMLKGLTAGRDATTGDNQRVYCRHCDSPFDAEFEEDAGPCTNPTCPAVLARQALAAALEPPDDRAYELRVGLAVVTDAEIATTGGAPAPDPLAELLDRWQRELWASGCAPEPAIVQEWIDRIHALRKEADGE